MLLLLSCLILNYFVHVIWNLMVLRAVYNVNDNNKPSFLWNVNILCNWLLFHLIVDARDWLMKIWAHENSQGLMKSWCKSTKILRAHCCLLLIVLIDRWFKLCCCFFGDLLSAYHVKVFLSTCFCQVRGVLN